MLQNFLPGTVLLVFIFELLRETQLIFFGIFTLLAGNSESKKVISREKVFTILLYHSDRLATKNLVCLAQMQESTTKRKNQQMCNRFPERRYLYDLDLKRSQPGFFFSSSDTLTLDSTLHVSR
eukprot:Sdes_comp19997_c0_seq1m12633